MVEVDLLRVEDDVLVHVEEQVVQRVRVLQLALPVLEAHEAVAEDDGGGDVVFADGLDGGGGPVEDAVGIEVRHAWLVAESVHCHQVSVSRLREEKGELVVHVQSSLGIEIAISAIQPANRTLPSAVIPPILAARKTVDVKVHTETVLPTIFDATEKVTP